MDIIYPDDGLLYVLNQLIAGSGSGLYWQLFTVNVTPSLSDTLATYATLPGSWAKVQLAASAFTLQQITVHVGTVQAANHTFTNTTGSPVDVYGYLVIDATDSKIVAAARFDGAPIVVPAGGTISITPILGDESELAS
jgi:hypothetical protein